MTDDIRKQIDEQKRKSSGGDERDSQGDGVADAAADTPKQQRAPYAQPSTNREAVPGGLEGSIMEGEDEESRTGA